MLHRADPVQSKKTSEKCVVVVMGEVVGKCMVGVGEVVLTSAFEVVVALLRGKKACIWSGID